jgi:7-keto-8-aminopelargonate synthetase-like enzyme
MMSEAFLTRISETLDTIRAEGLWKVERPIVSPQGGHISVAPDGRDMLNLCANNYLGLADHPALIAAAKTAMDRPRLRHGQRCASSAARRTCTGRWRQRLARLPRLRMTRSSSLPVSMPMAGCSSRFWVPRTR